MRPNAVQRTLRRFYHENQSTESIDGERVLLKMSITTQCLESLQGLARPPY